ncbi:MAG: hypothetical protein ACOYH4_05895, partial [Saccharofermentanales bacterium]
DYIEMIRQIFDDKGIEEPEISPQYTEEEAESIKSLISDISETIDTLFDEEGEKKSEGDEEDDLASN